MNLRQYIKTHDQVLGDRANNFWNHARPILDRQSHPGSNENGRTHVEMVEHNAWRLIEETGKLSDFTVYELFIISCAACSHDFDKGLLEESRHGEGSGNFLIEEFRSFQSNIPEMVAIRKIVSLHDLPNGEFQTKLRRIDKKFPIAKGTVRLQELAVILKASDILHTDNTRIQNIGLKVSRLEADQKSKHLARESITGWQIDGSRIILNAAPTTHEHLDALRGCEKYMKENEWPSVGEKLADYGFPYDLHFEIDCSVCGTSVEQKKN